MLRIISSARKHHLSDEVIYYVYNHAIGQAIMEEDPLKIAILGFDASLRPIELITIHNSPTDIVVIHADKATPTLTNFILNQGN